MKKLILSSILLVTALVIGLNFNGPATAGEPARHVVDAGQIQARLDRNVSGEAASRRAIQTMLARPDVRVLAEGAGLDMRRASAAVAVLSGPELKALAAQATEVNAGIGGSENVVISATALIIILLIIIIVAR